MLVGTFPKIGTGLTTADAIRPDFSGVNTATTRARLQKLVSETRTTMTCEYEMEAHREIPKLADPETGPRLQKLELQSASNLDVQKALAVVTKYLRELP